jgi:two-component system, OmpR family, sensor kinase
VTRTRRSLRGRLVLAFVAVAGLTAVLLGLITISLLRLVPERGLEQQLADQAAAVTEAVAGPRPVREACPIVRALRVGGTEVYVLGADAVPSWPSRCPAPNRLGDGPLAPVPAVDLAAALDSGQVVTGTRGGYAWAVAAADRPVLGGRGGVLLVHEVRRLGLGLAGVTGRRLLLASAVAVGLAALVAWLLAARLTAPLGRLVAAARRVGHGDLSTRVRVEGDDEVAEVASAFNDMAAGLEHAQAEQRAFLASVGHELKTPLTAVQGYTEALLDGTVEDPGERRRSLLRIHAETMRLARLVQDLLDLARLGRGQFAVSPVDADVGAVLREAAAAAADRAASRNLTVNTRLSGTLHAHVDPGRLRQVLDNLLDNATRSSPPGHPVLVAARPLPGGGVEAAVVDQGPGIAAADLPHAFDRGYLWARYRGTRAVGSGLGLAIVKGLCDAMGVAIRAESGDGGGTAFRLLLPPAHGAPPHGDATLPDRQAAQRELESRP